MLPNRNPTGRQLLVFKIVAEAIATGGFPPTLREIGTRTGIKSTNGVSDHLRALERKGFIRRSEMKARGLSLTHAGLALSGMREDALPIWLHPCVQTTGESFCIARSA